MNSAEFHFLFSSHPMKPKVADDVFEKQMTAIARRGFSVSCVPDSVWEENCRLNQVPSGKTVVYRGWMLQPDQYSKLEKAVNQAGAMMLTSKDQYLKAHHLPNWYPSIRDLTPETIVMPIGTDYEMEIKQLGWDGYFIKDFVKSITTSNGSIIKDADEIKRVLDDFVTYRGEIEGGLCARRIENFVHKTEERYFVLNQIPYARDAYAIPDLVKEVAKRVKLPFYSVDVIQREDGESRVVEIGDGQVSDLKQWSADNFASIWT